MRHAVVMHHCIDLVFDLQLFFLKGSILLPVRRRLGRKDGQFAESFFECLMLLYKVSKGRILFQSVRL